MAAPLLAPHGPLCACLSSFRNREQPKRRLKLMCGYSSLRCTLFPMSLCGRHDPTISLLLIGSLANSLGEWQADRKCDVSDRANRHLCLCLEAACEKTYLNVQPNSMSCTISCPPRDFINPKTVPKTMLFVVSSISLDHVHKSSQRKHCCTPHRMGRRAVPGIEPGTSRTRKNHATRPNSHTAFVSVLSDQHVLSYRHIKHSNQTCPL